MAEPPHVPARTSRRCIRPIARDRGDNFGDWPKRSAPRRHGRGHGLYEAVGSGARDVLAAISWGCHSRGRLRRRVALPDRPRRSGRATSCGPRPSRLMVQVLAREAIRLGMPISTRRPGLHIWWRTATRRAAGTVRQAAQRTYARQSAPAWWAFLCDYLVLAAGGPGELYRDSVYPRNCFGSLGLALEAGSRGSQPHRKPVRHRHVARGLPLEPVGNLRAVHALRVLAWTRKGGERNFLADYYRTTQELASNAFRKGYQWPFQATRMLDFGSSLFDLAVFRERQAGAGCYMDFNRNPRPFPATTTSARRGWTPTCRVSGQIRRPAGRPLDRLQQDESAVHRTLQAIQAATSPASRWSSPSTTST